MMADASYAVSSFLGGEISQYAQGRFDRPDYRISLNVCLNSFPVEIGAWTRRPGTKYAGHTRGGGPGRVMEFDFEQSDPVTLEFTNGFVRFRNGAVLITTNDAATISSISTANPAVVLTSSAHGWSTGNTVMFPAGTAAILENRQFTITVVDTTHFSLQDSLTGSNIDGSSLGTITTGNTVNRIHELQTVFGAGTWDVSQMRSVQAETTNIFLNKSIAPQALTVSSLPTISTNAVFDISAVTFNDGPYLDPFTNGVFVTPGSTQGIVTMTLGLPTWSSSVAYQSGSFVVSSGVFYKSLSDQNVNNTPVSSPSFWAPTSIGAAVNDGSGLSNTDIGRLVRFLSEPSPFDSSHTYGIGNLASYNPSGIPNENSYWKSLTNSNTGNFPGTDATNWAPIDTQGAALWTWGRITSLSNEISGSTGSNIGNMTGSGGLAASFDGVQSKLLTSSSGFSQVGGHVAFFTIIALDGYVGKHYSVSAQAIDHVVVYPSFDQGLALGNYSWQYNIGSGGPPGIFTSAMSMTFTLVLRGKNSAPSSASDGIELGRINTPNTSAPITITSRDSVTTYSYVWVELFVQFQNPQPAPQTSQTSYFIDICIAQLSFFNPTGTSSGAAFNVEILGPALLRTVPITTWRMGAFGGPNGYPSCGCYHEGRIWLGGAIPNRFDASKSNGVNGSTLDFAPTDQYGVVPNDAAIDYTLNSDSVNPIRWMKTDLQGVVIGTQNGEWLVQAPSTGPISSSNIASRRMTKHGSANIEPVRTPHANIFIKRFLQKIMEYFADAFSGKYSAPNLADKAQHITSSGVSEIAYVDATTPIIWGYDTLGSLFGITYKRDTLVTSEAPDFYAWHRHSLGSERMVQSICSGASVGGDLDSITIVTNDSSTDIRHVEVLTDTQDELTALADSWFLDDAVNPTSISIGSSSMTINGLWHCNGKTVQVFAAGLDLGDNGDEGTTPTDYVVSNGSVSIPYGDSISAGPGAGLFTKAFAETLSLSQIVIGFTYNSDGQIVRPMTPQETGARQGPAFSKISRSHRFGAQLVNTLGISFGTSFDGLKDAKFTKADEVTLIESLTTYSGMYHDTLDDDYNRFDRKLCWRVSRPLPATIVAIGPSLATQDQ